MLGLPFFKILDLDSGFFKDLDLDPDWIFLDLSRSGLIPKKIQEIPEKFSLDPYPAATLIWLDKKNTRERSSLSPSESHVFGMAIKSWCATAFGISNTYTDDFLSLLTSSAFLAPALLLENSGILLSWRIN